MTLVSSLAMGMLLLATRTHAESLAFMWQPDTSLSELRATAATVSDVPGRAVSRAPAPTDWPRVQHEWEKNFWAYYGRMSGWLNMSERNAAMTSLLEVRRIGEDVRKRARSDADRQIELFQRQTVPGTSADELRRRVEHVYSSRMLYVYGFLMPQSVNEGFSHWPLAGVPFPLYSTPESFCTLYNQAGKDLDALTERLDPNFFPPPQPGHSSICDRASWDASWFNLQVSPLPQP